MKFIDELSMSLTSGNGGPGCVSFRRETHVPRGGPDGGDGGRGGHVIVRVSERLNSLVHLRGHQKLRAQSGQPGMGARMSGKDGEDVILEVPEGTLIKDSKGQLLYDMTHVDGDLVLLEGGIGGKGNWFYKSSVNQAPNVAQKGMPGQALDVSFELKIIADVGIIGFPNVGKSTLISVISSAKPKIADYHFTTLTPNLGVVQVGDKKQSLVVADIPGLIKGAHEGVGLGIQFLKHIERTKFFLHIIDVSGMSGRDPMDDYNDINYELEMYDKGQDNGAKLGDPLAKRKQLVALNKVDTGMAEVVNEVKSQLNKSGVEYIEISAATGLNIENLKFKLLELVSRNS